MNFKYVEDFMNMWVDKFSPGCCINVYKDGKEVFRYQAGYNDLENKAKSNENIKKMAYDNAVDSMRAILMPLEKKLPAGYEFDFREGREAE